MILLTGMFGRSSYIKSKISSIKAWTNLKSFDIILLCALGVF